LVGQSKYGVEVRERIAGLGPGEELVVEDEWVDEFAVAGDAATVSERLRALLDAGADSLGLWLFPPARLGDQLKRFAADVLPSIGD
jgi:alkanesulfonate monooxygenase SsuD/methylene tetrahydromethanopterin reductase-like flavin-dependent oxidoreductase (luciferase family)